MYALFKDEVVNKYVQHLNDSEQFYELREFDAIAKDSGLGYYTVIASKVDYCTVGEKITTYFMRLLSPNR